MLSLVLLGCVFGDVKALKAEVASLQEEVDELEEELDAQSQVDTGEPVDSEDSGGGDSATPAEPFIVPSVLVYYTVTGSSPNYTYNATVEITGDYDAKRVMLYGTTMDEREEDCIEITGSSLPYVYVEFWYNGQYACWGTQAVSTYPDCHQIPYNVAELSCD